MLDINICPTAVVTAKSATGKKEVTGRNVRELDSVSLFVSFSECGLTRCAMYRDRDYIYAESRIPPRAPSSRFGNWSSGSTETADGLPTPKSRNKFYTLFDYTQRAVPIHVFSFIDQDDTLEVVRMSKSHSSMKIHAALIVKGRIK